MPKWADMFSPRRVILSLGVMVEELNQLSSDLLLTEGKELGELIHLLSFVIDKFADYNNQLSTWGIHYGCCKTRFSAP